MLSREELVEKHRHEIGGYVMDALTCGLTGAPLATFLRGMMRKIDQRLNLIHADMVPAVEPVAGRITPTKTG